MGVLKYIVLQYVVWNIFCYYWVLLERKRGENVVSRKINYVMNI